MTFLPTDFSCYKLDDTVILVRFTVDIEHIAKKYSIEI